ncbi:MAG: hypothetical protein ACRBN8_17335 [Nannocystales bacterium]
MLVTLAACTGCPRDSVPDPNPDQEPSATQKTAKLRKEAQKEALERLAPKVATLAALEDPITAALRDGTAPRMPPLQPDDRAALRTALEAADRESKGLTPRLLEPADRVVAVASRFAIDRARDTYVRRAPWADDPSWVTAQAQHVIAALEASARSDGTCTHCEVSLSHLEKTLPVASAGLQRMSKARGEAAVLDARALADRVRMLPGQADAPAALALETFASTVQGQLSSANEPARIGKAVLQRQLEVEENVGQTATELFKNLGASVSALAAMVEKRTVPEPEPPTTVTQARCEAAWADIAPVLEAHDTLNAEGFRCARFVAGLGTATLDDVGLRIAIIDAALVGPLRTEALQPLPDVLTSIGGRVARGSQAHTLRTALLLGAPPLQPAAARALHAELDAACLAAAALWIHGELGDDAGLAERLDKKCPRKTPSYISRAEARPRQALEGLALSRVSRGPAGVVPLDKLWWLPAGLIDDVALPPGDDDRPSPVRGTVEPLDARSPPPGAQDPAP